MNNETAQRLKDLIAQNNSIGILVGRNQSMDQMAAALGLYLTLKSLGKTVSVASPSNPLVEISSLVGIDKVKKALEGGEGGDLIVSFPYKEGEIEKVSYTLEGGYLNIIVKPGELGLSFDQRDVEYKHGGGAAPTLVFVIGTQRLSDLGNLFNPEAMKDTTVVNIDNRQDNQGFGDVVLVSNRFSSVSEQVTHLIVTLGYNLDQDSAQNLLSGISAATGNFQKQSTTPVAFEMAAVLMKKGALRDTRGNRVQQSPSEGGSFLPQNPGRQGGQFQDRGPRPQNQPRQGQGQFQSQRPQQHNQPRQHGGFNNQQQFGQNQQFSQPIAPIAQPEPVQAPVQPAPIQAPVQQPVRQPFPEPDFEGTSEARDNGSKEPPADWLTPKIYKGSSEL